MSLKGLIKKDAAKADGTLKRDAVKVEHALSGPFLAGLMIVAPGLVLGYVYNLIASPVKSLLGSASTSLFGLVGIGASLAGSAIFCLLLAYVILSILGVLYKYTKVGEKVVDLIDGALCHWKPWKAIRKMLKLPAKPAAPGTTPNPANGALPPHPDSNAIWAWIGGGWDLFGIRAEVPAADDATATMVSLWELSVPVPTGFTERWTNKAWTVDTGISFSQASAYREAGGGPLPDGCVPPPANAPGFAAATAAA